MEERKIKGEQARINQINEVKRSEEIEKENLKELEERIKNQSREQEKTDPN